MLIGIVVQTSQVHGDSLSENVHSWQIRLLTLALASLHLVLDVTLTFVLDLANVSEQGSNLIGKFRFFV